MSRRIHIVLALSSLFLASTAVPHAAAAQETEETSSSSETSSSGSEAEESPSGGEKASDEDSYRQTDDTDGDDASGSSEKGDDGGDSDEERESEHGSYEFKRSYGGGFEYGLFYTGLNRWDLHLLSPSDAPSIDAKTVSSFVLSGEASFLEGSRLTVFLGFEKPFHSNPSLLAVYGGLEPAFAFRRGDWEMALGLGVGLGGVSLSTESRGSFSAGLVVLRPVLELRRYVDDLFAAYLRIGFNQWLPYNTSGDSLTIRTPPASRPGLPAENLLYEGGVFTALGFRFGYYPEPVKHIPDSDGDGLRNDVDDCDDEPEDEDGFEDFDGCPDPDNDGDGIKDENDACPDEAEDIDRFEDEDGCPDAAADIDGDGIIDAKDECPKYAEDEDGFEDDDGCPDPDNDDDGIEDDKDECPNEPGIEAEKGCPSTIVELDEETFDVKPAIRFQVPEGERPDEPRPGAELTSDSEKALDEVAAVLKLHTELARIEIQGHTGEGDDDEEMETLSQKRADAVRSYLVDAGVNGDRLEAKGYGMSKPVMPENAGEDAEKAPKARIDFVVKKRKTSSSGDEGASSAKSGADESN